MPSNNKKKEEKAGKKEKGGAQKKREMKEKQLMLTAKKCQKINVLFSKQSTLSPAKLTQTSADFTKRNLKKDDNQTLADSGGVHISEDSVLDLSVSKEVVACKNLLDPTFEQVNVFPELETTDSVNSSSFSENADSQGEKSSHGFSEKRPYETEVALISECNGESIDYFSVPKQENLELFFKFHPKQEINDPVLQKAFRKNEEHHRTWLSYSVEKNSLFCIFCLAFSKTDNKNAFVRGFSDRSHIHLRVESHENGPEHKQCVEAFILERKNLSLRNLIDKNWMATRRKDITDNRKVVERVVDVLKLIGKRYVI